MRQRRQQGKTSIVTLVVFIGLCVAGWYFVPGYLRENRYVKNLNRCRRLFSAGQWEACLDGYDTLMATYPEKGEIDRPLRGEAHANWASELYTAAISSRQDYDKVVARYETAAGLQPLPQKHLLNYADACCEIGQWDRVAAILAEAERRDDVDAARFGIVRKRMEQKRR